MTLLARLEQAEIGSRELDILIHYHNRAPDFIGIFYPVETGIGTAIACLRVDGDKAEFIKMAEIPAYTTSIDSALTLMPEGYLVNLESIRTENGDQFTWWVWKPELADKNRSGPGRNRILTLCIAALRARGLE